VAGRDVTYLTFGDAPLRGDLEHAHAFLRRQRVTVGKLFRSLVTYRGVHGGRPGRPDVLTFLYGHLASDEYGSDTDLEREDWSQEMDMLDAADSEVKLDHNVSAISETPSGGSEELTFTEEDQPPAAGSSDSAAGEAGTSGEARPIAAEARLDAGEAWTSAEARLDAGEAEAGSRQSLPGAASGGADSSPAAPAAVTKRVRRSDGGAATQQFAKFELVSELSRARGLRQASITSYLKK